MHVFCGLQFLNSNSLYMGSLLYGSSSLHTVLMLNCISVASPEASVVLIRSHCYPGPSLTQSKSFQEGDAVFFYTFMRHIMEIRKCGVGVVVPVSYCLRVTKHILNCMKELFSSSPGALASAEVAPSSPWNVVTYLQNREIT